MLQFNQQSSATGNRDLIPGATLAWAVLSVKGMKIGQPNEKGQSRYAECELTIVGGQYERRKIFVNVMDPTFEKASDGAKQMGYGALSRMLESSGLVNVQDPNSYARVNGQSFDTLMAWLDGKRVAIKVKIAKGQNGYADKNDVGDWLSPNPISSSYNDFQKLQQQANMPAAVAPGGPAPAAPTWGAGAAAPAAPTAPSGFTPPPQTASPGVPAAQNQTAGDQTAPSSAPMTPSPSDPANPPAAAWLKQAQGGQ